jgi:hypothetical protein
MLFGGGGGDLFVFSGAGGGDSNAVAGSIDQIKDWAGGVTAAPTNFLHFADTAGAALAGGLSTNYTETTGTDFNDAVVQANAHLGGAGLYVAVQIGTDVVVFADTDGNHSITAADTAVVLVGKSLSDIDFTNIV